MVVQVRMSPREIAVAGMMLGLSFMLEVVPIEMPTMWGMKIDLVAVPIIVTYFLLGLRGGLSTVFLMFLGLGMVSPAGWLGAFMKASATLSMVIGLELARRLTRVEFEEAPSGLFKFAVLGYLLGIAVRIPLMVAFNYYFAIEMFLGIPHEQVVEAVEKWTGVPFWVAIGLPNAIQGAIDVFVSATLLGPLLRRVPHFFE